ncbi:MAG TPA: RNA polymerase sigma factor [Phycisphaerales bacterium]|nr:RNA polymerase sigma factor [Phycisphaerales bacterium]
MAQPEDQRGIAPGLSLAESEDTWLRAAWAENRRWVAAVLLAYKPAWADVEDLLQDVALSVVRKLPELRDPEAVRGWLRTVAINAAHAAARKGKRWSKHESLDGVVAAIGVDAHAEAEERSRVSDEGRRLLRLAAKLPEGYREPLLLKAVHGMSYREIGRVMDIPETTVETRIARARKRLRELAEQREEDDAALTLEERGGEGTNS